MIASLIGRVADGNVTRRPNDHPPDEAAADAAPASQTAASSRRQGSLDRAKDRLSGAQVCVNAEAGGSRDIR